MMALTLPYCSCIYLFDYYFWELFRLNDIDLFKAIFEISQYLSCNSFDYNQKMLQTHWINQVYISYHGQC